MFVNGNLPGLPGGKIMNATENSSSQEPSDFKSPDFFKFEGKRFVVTGGSKGIGRAVVEMLLQAGAEVWVVSRDADLQSERIEDWRSQGWRAHGVVCDLKDPESRATALTRLKNEITSLKGLILNAGVNIRKKTSEYTPEDLRAVWGVNYESVFEFCQGLYPALKKNKNGSVTFISSVAGMRFVPSGAPYATSKAAVDQLTRYLAVEWAQDGVRVNGIAPWYIRTQLAEPVLKDTARLRTILSATPLNRIGEPGEVANLALFLSSDAASYITGQVIAVDGGFLAQGISANSLVS